MAAPKMTKNQMRRAKKKEEKKAKAEAVKVAPPSEAADAPADVVAGASDIADDTLELAVKKEGDSADVIPSDGPVEFSMEEDDPSFAAYKEIFARFGSNLEGEDAEAQANGGNKGEVFYSDDDDIPDEEEEATGQTKLSKKKRKKLNKLSIAELKALVKNPEVVEWQDTSSSDPRLLVQIKAQRNIVPVPGHWSLKREYLSSKRGIEKPPFKLPKFIAETGITEMRDAVLEKQAEQSLKQKQRERVQPKMGKLDIDYQRLYDAFFRFQTKPSLTRFGDVYYEGKEWEADYRHFKPGDVSEALRDALGIQPGFPPPWLLQQQRMGPPPSYPTLKIPGLNAPLPAGAAWGFAPGQWGKPPLDEYNRPIYGGDIFGIMAGNPAAAPTQQPQAPLPQGEPIERNLWGELQPPQEESEDEESEEESEEEEDEEQDVPGDSHGPGGLETPGGLASSVPTEYPGAPSGVESSMAGEFDLRKQRRGYETEESTTGPRSAYTVVPERQTQVQGFFGSDRAYDLSKNSRPGMPVLGDDDSGRKRKKPGDVDVALDPDALQSHDGINKDDLQRRYDEGRREDGPGAKWQYDDDLSEMIAQESRKRQKRDEDRRGGGNDKKKEAKYRF
jgi:splicing factor 3B subunit 2